MERMQALADLARTQRAMQGWWSVVSLNNEDNVAHAHQRILTHSLTPLTHSAHSAHSITQSLTHSLARSAHACRGATRRDTVAAAVGDAEGDRWSGLLGRLACHRGNCRSLARVRDLVSLLCGRYRGGRCGGVVKAFAWGADAHIV